MERLVGYAAAVFASLLGWQFGRALGPVAGFLIAVVLAGVGMYVVRRWWRQNVS